MFLAVMIINFFQISVKSLQKVLLPSKIIIIFCSVAENKLETMGYDEIISNFIPETHFCCYNTGAKSEQFFYVASSKNPVEIMWGYLHFFPRVCSATYCFVSARKVCEWPPRFK